MSVELNRSKDLYNNPKPRRQQEHQKMSAPVGPSSSNPGPWLTFAIVDSLIHLPHPRLILRQSLFGWAQVQYEQAYVALDSFRFKPLYRTTRTPVPTNLGTDDVPQPSTTFEDGVPALESTSFCVLKSLSPADTAVLTAHERGENFRMIEQPNVLSGPALREWLAARWTPKELKMRAAVLRKDAADDIDPRDEQSDEELERVDATDLEDTENAPEEEVLRKAGYMQAALTASVAKKMPQITKTRVVTVTPAELNAHHALWVADPSKVNRERLAELIYHFTCRKTRLVPKKDALRIAGLSDDFQTDFLLSTLELLERKSEAGEPIDKPYSYIGTVWENDRKAALKKFSKDRKKFPSVDLTRSADGEPSDDADDGAPNRIDEHEYQEWAGGVYVSPLTETSEEEKRLDRWAKFESLSPEKRDLVGYVLMGYTQDEIGETKNKTQQAVSKELTKITRELRAMPETVGTR